MTSRLQVPFWDSALIRFPLIVPNRERRRDKYSPRQSGFLEKLSENPLLCLEMFLGLARSRHEPRPAKCTCSFADPLWLGLFRRRRSGGFLLGCFTAASTEQREGILGAEGEAANGLLAGGAQSDVDAAVVGHANGQLVLQNLLLFRRGQVGFRFDQFLDLFRSHVLFKAKRAGLDMVGGHALFHQVGLDTFHATLGELHVVVFGAANVSVTF